MNQPENTLREFELAQKRQRDIAQLAEALAHCLRIPAHESQLVWFLGIGGERRNIDALRTWVDRHFEDRSDIGLREQREELEIKLRGELINLQSM